MTDPFEYDVFLSFSSADEEIVKPIWQELCSNGLRVFWSDSTLKKEVGNSWFEVIERSIERSRHMLLICSDSSMNSKWVQREYRAFFDYCYSSNSRRLIPLLAREFKPNNLPLFLRQLQVGKINNPQFIQEIIPILGGVNIEKLQYELQSLKEQVNLLLLENESLSENSKAEGNKVNALAQENTAAKEQIAKLSDENTSLKEYIAKLANESNFLNKTLQERENLLSSENKSLEEQIAKLTNENNLLNERLQERENSFSSQNTSLKEQIAKLTNESNSLNEKLKEQDKSLSSENKSLEEQIAKLTNENNYLKDIHLVEGTLRGRRIGWPRLVVCNLADEVSSSDLWTLFLAAGSIKLSQVIKDEAGHPTGFGLIVMSTYMEAEKAIEMFHGKDYQGRPLNVYQIT